MEIESVAGSNLPALGAFVNEGVSRDYYPAPVLLDPQQKYFRIINGLPAGYVGVWLTPETPVDLRKLADDFNFGCLSKLGGCKTVDEMLSVLERKDLYHGQDQPWLQEKTTN
jgi:hypothetical protein